MGYIYGLLTQEELADPKLMQDIFTIMKTVPSYCTIIIWECMNLIGMLRQRKTYKRISASNILGVIQFSQNMMQNGYKYKDPFMQLPMFELEDVVKMYERDGELTFYKFCKLAKEERKKIMDETFPGNTKKADQIEKCIDALPVLDVVIEAGTLGHDEVCVNDLLNVKIKVNLSKLTKGQQMGYVHSRQYPFLKKDEWFLLITDRSLS